MKKFLLFALCALIGMTVYAQDCYNSTRKEGISLYNQGKKTEARRYFVAAKSCPDRPEKHDLDSWIKKCDYTPTPASDKATINVSGVKFYNVTNGELITPPVASADMKSYAPHIYYSVDAKSNAKGTIHTKLFGPDDKLIRNSTSPSGYTAMRNVTLMPDTPDSVAMPDFSNYNGGVYSNGEYRLEVYFQNAMVYNFRFQVLANRPKLVVNDMAEGVIYTRNISAAGGTQSYSIETDGMYEVINKCDWITVKSRGIDRLVIEIAPNPSDGERQDYFVLKVQGLQRTVWVYQLGNRRNNNVVTSTPQPADDVKRLTFDGGASLLITSTTPTFKSSRTTQTVINYGINDLPDCHNKPEYASGVGFDVHFNAHMMLANRITLNAGLAIANGGFSTTYKSDGWYYTQNSIGMQWDVEQKFEETYRLTYLDIPITAAYRLPLGSSKNAIHFKGGFVFGLGLSGILTVNGTQYEQERTTASTYSYRNSKLSGTVNLFNGKYEFINQYTTGAASTYEIDGVAENPYNAFNMSFRLGVDFEFGHFMLGLSYNIGLSNIANDDYWESVEDQVPGFYILDTPSLYLTTNPLKDYKQSLGSFAFSASYCF